MELKKIKFSVILPILERKDIVKGFPMAIGSIFKNSIVPDQVLVVVDGFVSKSFKGLINTQQIANTIIEDLNIFFHISLILIFFLIAFCLIVFKSSFL